MSASDITATDLVAGAAAAVVLDAEPAGRYFTFDVAVTVAALSGLEVWGKGNRSGAWQPIATQAADFTSPTGLSMSVVSDGTNGPGSADATVTPAGSTATIGVRCDFWKYIQVRAKSAGAAHVEVSTGSKA